MESLFPEPERYLYCDGASKGNPGPASIGAIIYERDPETENSPGRLIQISRAIGHATNNVAEYESLIAGLEALQEDRATPISEVRLHIRMDSQLVVRQVLGQYKVKNENMKPLHQKVMKILSGFAAFEAKHLPREKNKEADALANEALK